MDYEKHNYQSGDILQASQLNEMDEQIEALTEAVDELGQSGGIPSGGLKGQVLTKTSFADYDVSWTTVTGSAEIDDTAGAGDTDRVWSANKVSGELSNIVSYTAVQNKNFTQQARARSNIGAMGQSDVSGLVSDVTESEGIITVTHKDGSASSFEIPKGLTFDGGYCAVSQLDGKTYLHLTANGEEIEDFLPIEIPSGGMEFNGGYCAEDPEDGKYYLHLTMDDVELELDDFTPIEIPAAGGGVDTSTIVLTNVSRPTVVRNGANANFSFTATSSDDTDITAIWYVNSVQISDPREDASGGTFSFNAGIHLRDSSTNNVRVILTSSGGGRLSRQWTVTTTAFSLSWGSAISPITLFTENENVYAVINVSAQVGTTNTVTVSVGEHEVVRSVSGTRSITVELSKDWFETGVNTVTASMVSGIDSEDRADDISFVAVWGYGATTPIVAFASDVMEGVQYDLINIPYFVYDPDSELASCSIQVGLETPRSIVVNRTMQIYTYFYSEEMEETITQSVILACKTSSTVMTLTIDPSEYNIGKVTGDSLRYDLDPVGHSNSDADREDFGGMIFSAGFDWVNGGFQIDSSGAAAFVVKKGHQVTLPRSLFADTDANGKVIDVSFKIANSDQYDATAMLDMNNGLTKGLILKANEGELRLDNASGQVFYYGEDRRVDLSVHVEDAIGQRLVTIWLDGIPSKVDAYEASSLVQSENSMAIGSEHCDVWIYAIHIYNAKLSNMEMIQNYISLGSNTEEKISRFNENNIFDSNDKVTVTNLHRAAPNLTIVEIEIPRMTTNKKDPVPADIRITDGTTVLELDAASASDAKDGALIKVQGTSSAAYGRSSYNLDLDFKGTGKKYKLSENAIPVNYINIKVNVASSENANNINAVDWYNAHQPYLTIPRSRPGVRDTVEGKPCAVFIRNNSDSAAWFSSQYVQPGETVLYAMGDICNSKKNLEVFGEDGEGEHHTKACVEVSGNDTQAQQFLATATYNDEDGEWQNTIDGQVKTEFEWRMEPSSEDLSTVVDAWDDAVAWVVSTVGNSAKFKSEVGNYFAIESLLYHFLFLEYFAAYDNVSKNTFYSYDWDENAQKYLWNIKAAYDWDTILASDNDGKPFGDYGLDYGDTVGGRHYFNASGNPIWLNIQDAFQSELSAMYTSLRSSGTWDSGIIASKWDTYQSLRPHAAMVEDAYIKYIYPYKTTGVIIGGQTYGYDDSYLPRLNGSKTYQRQRFLKYQTYYMDGKYGYFPTSGAMLFRSNAASGTTKDFTVKAYTKTYVAIRVDANNPTVKKIESGDTEVFESISVGNNATIYASPQELIQYIRPLNETYNSTFAASGANKLMEVILGGETANNAWPSGTGLNIPSPIMKDFSIRNIANFSSAVNLSQNVELETVDTRGTNAGRITLPSYAPLDTIRLNACSGIVAMNLNHVTVLSMASGENLTYVRMENCNAVVNRAILDCLEDMKTSQSIATRNVRLIGIDWMLEDTALLNWLLTIGGIDESGSAVSAPCVITGSIYIPTVMSIEYLRYERAWPGVVSYGQMITSYVVSFYDYDGVTPILDKNGDPYVQYVDAGGNAYDPILADEVDIPVRAPDEQYTYTYSGWDNLPSGILDDTDVIATYTSSSISYTVQWYDGVGSGDGTLIEQKMMIAYGSSVTPTNPIPKYTDLEASNVYYVFRGWDKSTAFIRPDPNADPAFPYTIKVHALWITGNLPSISSNPGLWAMSWAQRYAVAKNNLASSYWEPGENMQVTLGHGDDYEFSNVESDVLISQPTFFNGGTPMIFNGENDLPLIQLFNGTIDRFTLAIDFEMISDSGSLAACFADNGNQGFHLRRISDRTNVLWGDQNVNVGYKYQRSMLVIRYNHGMYPLVLYMTHDGNLIGNEYPVNVDSPETNVTTEARARSIATGTNAPLTFGGIGNLDGTDIPAARGQGWIYWAKIWYDDIGVDCAKSIAAMPHVTTRFKYTQVRYRDSLASSGTVAADFFDEGCVPLRARMNYTYSNVGGWSESHRRKWLNGQYFAGLPIPLQSIIVEARIRSTEGGGTDEEHALNILNSMDKIYLPSYAELFATITGNNSDNIAYIDECDDSAHRMPDFIYDSTKGQTADIQARIRWPGITLPEDANYIVGPNDPTITGLGYTVHSGKTVWINTNYESVGFLYINSSVASEHKWYAGWNLSDTEENRIISAIGTDSDGGTGGIWIRASLWWSRSPVVSMDGTFWSVYDRGSMYPYYGANGALGLSPRFSI